MREILFRGTPTERFADFPFIRPDLFENGWVYGSLVICDNKYYICTHTQCSNRTAVNNAHATMVEVVPESVGQFTGKVDKNGKRIFEKDVVIAMLDYGPAGAKRATTIIDFNNDGGYRWEYFYMDTIEIVGTYFSSLYLMEE